jgi:hypothetical protein
MITALFWFVIILLILMLITLRILFRNSSYKHLERRQNKRRRKNFSSKI